MTPTGRLLLNAFRCFENTVIEQLANASITDITASHLNVMRHLNPEGLRLTDLAKDANLTKQATSAIVKELVELGYFEVRPDPQDGRAKIVHYTTKGQQLRKTSIGVVIDIERHFRDLLGESSYLTLRSQLQTLCSGV
ncbi:MAG: MarR family transcriptional regulator [Gammaproteobacteria bacterium]|nr:MarR family transcriptional regulator [Gammaproteobacteria bacterium]